MNLIHNKIDEQIAYRIHREKFILENDAKYEKLYYNMALKLHNQYLQRNTEIVENMFLVCENEAKKLKQFGNNTSDALQTTTIKSDEELKSIDSTVIDHNLFGMNIFELESLFKNTRSFNHPCVNVDLQANFNNLAPTSIITILQQLVRDRLGLKLLIVYRHTTRICNNITLLHGHKMILSNYEFPIRGESFYDDITTDNKLCDVLSLYPFSRAV